MKLKFLSSVVGAVAMLLVLQGCAVQKQMQATGGSRADGTVKLAYEFNMFEKPVVNMSEGAVTAAQRCKSWGYSGAEAFGGQTKTCNSYGSGGCNGWLVTVEYQCTGSRPIAAQ